MRLLFHTCSHRAEILDPSNYKENAICLSENVFISALGEWLYIFDYETLNKFYCLEKRYSGGYSSLKSIRHNYSYIDIRYDTIPIEYEYRIHEKIYIKEHALGYAKNYDASSGRIKVIANQNIFKTYEVIHGKIKQ